MSNVFITHIFSYDNGQEFIQFINGKEIGSLGEYWNMQVVEVRSQFPSSS